MTKNKKNQREIDHFSNMDHIWWGHKTVAGQKRYDDKLRVFKEKCNVKKTHKILEIGAGDGEFTKRLKTTGASIIATDITHEVIKRAKKIIKNKNVKFKIENAEKLSFKDNQFDFVCGVSILHHINIAKSLKEAHRVLKRGGKIFFFEPNIVNPVIFLGLNIPVLRKKWEYSPDEIALDRWKTKNLLKRIGFKNIRVENYDFLHPSTPERFIGPILTATRTFEKTPLIKEISGSLYILAQK